MAKIVDTTRQEYNQSFLEALEMLNPAQQEAVDQIEGPVMVLAGPGTGKTHILAARIGRILLETDTLPRNILCLTFTDAGVHAMRNRLQEFIGPEAHRVHIYTFHSFCNNIIQENLELFGRHDLEPISELERVELIRQLIDDLPLTHPLKSRRRDQYFYESHLHDLFQRMKSEDWTAAYLHQKIEEYIDSLPQRKEYIYQRNTQDFKKGDLKNWKINDVKEKMDRLRVAVELFPNYSRMLYQQRRYDFADMIIWVLRAFEKDEALLRTYQERYLYFLVDEFQDTNGSQNFIIQKLIAYWSTPNIFIVGDDDQSIFEFQGARLKNLTDFYQDHQPDIKLVLLQENYRSSQPILDTTKLLIDHNQKRITTLLGGIDKKLQAKNKEVAKLQQLPIINTYSNRSHEEVDIVQQLEALQASGVPMEEIAIIYARHRQVSNIISLLEKKGMPYSTRREVNILDLPLIQRLRNLLEYIREERDHAFSGEHRVFQLLHYDFWEIKATDLAKLSYAQAQHTPDKRLFWRDVIRQKELLERCGITQPDSILRCSKLLNLLVIEQENLTLLALLERLINRSGLLHQILNEKDKDWQLQVIHTFFEFVKKETDRNPRITLERLLNMLQHMDDNRIAIGANRNIVASKGVNLVTAHSSKGLEFSYVFILDATKENWEPAKRHGSRRFVYPDTLTLSDEEDAMEARRRLFYVAMTRAKRGLILSYSEKNLKGKLLERAQYIDEILTHPEINITPRTLDAEQLIEAQVLQLLEVEHPVLPEAEWDRVEAMLEGFTLSISSLNQYLRCPLSFYYNNVLRIPSAQSEAATYGIAMHNALRRQFDKMKNNPTQHFPSKEEFLSFFTEDLDRLRSYFTPMEYERRTELGKLHLSDYYDIFHNQWTTQVLTEHQVRNVELEGVPLTGTIDRLDLHAQQQVYLVDYKTGSTNAAKLYRPSKSNPLGGSYWRQLVFYKILYELHQAERKITSGAISYLEPDSKGEYPIKTVEFRAQDVEVVKKMIVDTYANIRQHKLYEGCGEKNCQWCNFVKQNRPINSFSDPEIEALDD